MRLASLPGTQPSLHGADQQYPHRRSHGGLPRSTTAVAGLLIWALPGTKEVGTLDLPVGARDAAPLAQDSWSPRSRGCQLYIGFPTNQLVCPGPSSGLPLPEPPFVSSGQRLFPYTISATAGCTVCHVGRRERGEEADSGALCRLYCRRKTLKGETLSIRLTSTMKISTRYAQIQMS